jgi:hypothetical protein
LNHTDVGKLHNFSYSVSLFLENAILYSHHAPCGGEADSHPSLSLSLHVDIKDPRISSVGVNSNETGTVGHIASRWGAEGQTVVFWITHLDNEIILFYHTSINIKSIPDTLGTA